MFQIVFRADLALGADPDQVRDRFARQFRIDDPAKLDALFSGRRCVLKKGLDAEQASAYLAMLRSLGALAEMEQMANPTPAAPMARASTMAAAPVPPTGPGTASPARLSDGWSLAPVERRVEPAPVAEPEAASAAETFYRPSRTSGSPSRSPLAMPAEVGGLSWGAFFWGWIWGLGNGTYIALLTLLPGINIVMAFVLLFKGRQWAWQNKHWDSLDAFNRSQRRWSVSGWIICVLSVLFVFKQSNRLLASDEAMAYEDDTEAEEVVSSDAEDRRIAERIEQVKDPALREKLRALDQARRQQRDHEP